MFPKQMPIYWRTQIVGQTAGFFSGALFVNGLVKGEWNLVAASFLVLLGGIATTHGYQRWIAEAGPDELPPQR